MRQLAVLVVSLYLAAGAVGWSTYAAWTFVYRELSPSSDWTAKFVYYGGRVVLWAFGLIAGGVVAGAAAWTVWRAVGGGGG
jgi:hypothetical protein